MTALGIALILVGFISIKLLEPHSKDSYTIWEVSAVLVFLAGVVSFWVGVIMFVAKVMP